MAAVGDHAQLGAQPATEIEGVGDRELGVARAPEDERRAADTVEVAADVVEDERRRRALGIARQPCPLEEPVDRGPRHDQRVGCPPVAEDEPSQHRAVGDGIGPGRDEPPGADDAEDPQSVFGTPRHRRDPGRRRQHERLDQVRAPDGEPDGDHGAERVTHERRGRDPLELGDGADTVGEDGEVRHDGQRRRAAVARQFRNEDAALRREDGRDVGPVERRAAQPVHEDDRLCPAAPAHEVTEPAPADLGEALLEPGH